MSKHIEEIAEVIRNDADCLNGYGLNVKRLAADYEKDDVDYIINRLTEIKNELYSVADIINYLDERV